METLHHCHSHAQEDDLMTRSARKKLIIVSVLCFVFMVCEIVGGVIANSLAIITDAAHIFSDLVGFLIGLVGIYIASRPSTKRLSFGWHRAEVMTALISVVLIWILTAVLVYLAVQRVITGDYEIESFPMLIISILGIAFNIIMLVILGSQPGSHGHSHLGFGSGHSHVGSAEDHAEKEAKPKPSTDSSSSGAAPGPLIEKKNKGALRQENINVKSAYLHTIGDLAQSVGIFIAAMIIFFRPNAKIADPICTFVFSVIVLITTIPILRDVLSVLMEAAPRDVSFNDVRRALCAIEGVTELHDLRLWQLTPNKPALAVHLAIDSTVDTQQVLAKARTIVREQFRIYECTFQVERYETQMGDCERCMDPKK